MYWITRGLGVLLTYIPGTDYGPLIPTSLFLGRFAETFDKLLLGVRSQRRPIARQDVHTVATEMANTASLATRGSSWSTYYLLPSYILTHNYSIPTLSAFTILCTLAIGSKLRPCAVSGTGRHSLILSNWVLLLVLLSMLHVVVGGCSQINKRTTDKRRVASKSRLTWPFTTHISFVWPLTTTTMSQTDTLSLVTPSDFPAFPYSSPYQIQLDLMRHLYSSIEQKKIAIIESPTGTVMLL